MKYGILGLQFLLAFLISASGAKAEYYYSDSTQIPLRVDSSKACVKFADSTAQSQLIGSHEGLLETITDSNALEGFEIVMIEPGPDLYLYLDSLNNTEGISAAEPYYYFEDTVPLPIGDQMVVAFDEDLDNNSVYDVASAFGTDTVREIEYMPNVWVLRNVSSQTQRTLDIANSLYLNANVYFSHPIFGARHANNSYRLFDYYHEYQWHLKKIIGNFNEKSVWDFQGVLDTIIVAVIDDGIEWHHEFLSARVLPGRDYSELPYDNDPSPGLRQAHGMACAGIIAAGHVTDSLEALANPNSGVVGLSPAVKILPVKIGEDDGGGATADEIAPAVAFAWQNGADILSCSWSFPVPQDIISTALDRAADYGRQNLGCLVVFSSGNNGRDQVNYPARRSKMFAVGALTSSDARWSYSHYGNDLDLCAPSGALKLQGDVWTCDATFAWGYNPFVTMFYGESVTWDCGTPNNDDFNCHFGGTSAACPFVSGTAALILSRDTSLARTEVDRILRYSAVRLGSSWPNPTYGYGRVDAFRAVLSIARGDCNNSGDVDVSDLTRLVNRLLVTFEPMFPTDLLGDCNCDGIVDMSDVTKLNNHLFVTFEPLEVPCFNYDNADW